MHIIATFAAFLMASTMSSLATHPHKDATSFRHRQLSSPRPYPDPEQVVDDYLTAARLDMNLTEADISNKRITNKYSTSHNGITHLYYIQTYEGIDVTNGVMNFNVDSSGQVIGKVGSSFVSDLKTKASGIMEPTITPAEAIQCAAVELRLQSTSPPNLISSAGGPAQESTFDGDEISQEDITAKLVFYGLECGGGELAWELELSTLNQEFWGNVWVNARSSECIILGKSNWINADGS